MLALQHNQIGRIDGLQRLTKLQSLQLPQQFFDEAAQRGEVHFVVGKKLKIRRREPVNQTMNGCGV